MASSQKSPFSARLHISLTATQWAAIVGVWFGSMTAIAIWAGYNPAGIPALFVVFFGGVFVFGGLGLLTYLSDRRE